MLQWTLQLVGFFFIFSHAQVPKMFSSKEHMEDMVETEKTLFQVLDNYTLHLEERAQKLKTFHAEFRKAFELASNGVEDYLNNPVSAFIFTRRLLVTWRQVESIMSGDVGKDWARDIKINRLLKSISLPSQEDLSYAAGQIKKLQDQYQLNATEMAKGGPYGVALNSGECFELGREAYEDEDFDRSSDWLQEALNHVQDGRAEEADIVEYLAAVAYLKGQIRKALKLTQRILELQPKHSKARNNLKYYTKSVKQMEKDQRKAQKKDIVAEVVNWQSDDVEEFMAKICRREVGVSESVKAKLKCRLVNQDNAYLKLAKLKEEVVFPNPRIVLYHEVLSDSTIASLRNLAAPKLLPHELASNASQATLADAAGEVVTRVSEQAALVSGLDISYSDMLQVVRYDVDGGLKPRFDREEANSPIVDKAGNKLATVQFFLDSAKGGATVFPALKLAIEPQKGSALLWFNSKDDGRTEALTMHGTCQVSTDQHWDAVKFIRSFGNERTQPCGLTQRA